MAITIKSNHFAGMGNITHDSQRDGGQSGLASILRSIADAMAGDKSGGAGVERKSGGVLVGLMAAEPSTPSAQLTGTGNTDWNVNIDKGVVEVGGVRKEFAAQEDVNVHTGSFITGLVSGASVVAALVAKKVDGTISLASVLGTPATTDAQVAPTDAEIEAALTDLDADGDSWVRVADLTLNRTADTSVTQSEDNTVRDAAGLDLNSLPIVAG
jgi:hypothetical protein